jgi:flagellar hook-associated protein 3 FlgL
MGDHQQLQQLGTYQANAQGATSNLNASVSALQSVNGILTQANQLASEGASSSTDAEGYVALANQVDGLIQQMLSTANTRTDTGYLFGGTASGQVPFKVTAVDASGRPLQISYQGSSERQQILIGPGQTMDQFYAGNQVFQQSGADVFQTLLGMRDDLRNPNLDLTGKAQAMSQRMAQLQQSSNSILDTVGEQSAGLQSLQALNTRIGDLQISVQQRASDLESTDLAQAAVKLQEQQNLYQATLAVTAKLFSNNFLNFVQ